VSPAAGRRQPTEDTGRVRIPADVDRPDKLLAGLTARQLAILAVAAVVLWAAMPPPDTSFRPPPTAPSPSPSQPSPPS